ncbi:MAG: hypothetical protein RL518_555 [Pseudomonadota bacterium]
MAQNAVHFHLFLRCWLSPSMRQPSANTRNAPELEMDITCFHCKKPSPLELVSGRAVVSFRASCPHCSSDLHVCLNCSLHDRGAYHECRETSAEWVKDKERGNKCEYFQPRTGSDNKVADVSDKVKSALDDLFK